MLDFLCVLTPRQLKMTQTVDKGPLGMWLTTIWNPKWGSFFWFLKTAFMNSFSSGIFLWFKNVWLAWITAYFLVLGHIPSFIDGSKKSLLFLKMVIFIMPKHCHLRFFWTLLYLGINSWWGHLQALPQIPYFYSFLYVFRYLYISLAFLFSEVNSCSEKFHLLIVFILTCS